MYAAKGGENVDISGIDLLDAVKSTGKESVKVKDSKKSGKADNSDNKADFLQSLSSSMQSGNLNKENDSSDDVKDVLEDSDDALSKIKKELEDSNCSANCYDNIKNLFLKLESFLKNIISKKDGKSGSIDLSAEKKLLSQVEMLLKDSSSLVNLNGKKITQMIKDLKSIVSKNDGTPNLYSEVETIFKNIVQDNVKDTEDDGSNKISNNAAVLNENNVNENKVNKAVKELENIILKTENTSNSVDSKDDAKLFLEVKTILTDAVKENTSNAKVTDSQVNEVVEELKNIASVIKSTKTAVQSQGSEQLALSREGQGLLSEIETVLKDVQHGETSLQNTKSESTGSGKEKEADEGMSFLKQVAASGEDDKNQINPLVTLKANDVSKANLFTKEIQNQPNFINKNNILNDVVKTIKYMQTNDVKNLTVKVVPKELGEITIKITEEEGKISAVITTNNKQTYNLINSNLKDISNNLHNDGIYINNFSLSNLNSGFSQNNENSDKNDEWHVSKNRYRGMEDSSEEDDDEEKSNAYDKNNVNILV